MAGGRRACVGCAGVTSVCTSWAPQLWQVKHKSLRVSLDASANVTGVSHWETHPNMNPLPAPLSFCKAASCVYVCVCGCLWVHMYVRTRMEPTWDRPPFVHSGTLSLSGGRPSKTRRCTVIREWRSLWRGLPPFCQSTGRTSSVRSTPLRCWPRVFGRLGIEVPMPHMHKGKGKDRGRRAHSPMHKGKGKDRGRRAHSPMHKGKGKDRGRRAHSRAPSLDAKASGQKALAPPCFPHAHKHDRGSHCTPVWRHHLLSLPRARSNTANGVSDTSPGFVDEHGNLVVRLPAPACLPVYLQPASLACCCWLALAARACAWICACLLARCLARVRGSRIQRCLNFSTQEAQVGRQTRWGSCADLLHLRAAMARHTECWATCAAGQGRVLATQACMLGRCQLPGQQNHLQVRVTLGPLGCFPSIRRPQPGQVAFAHAPTACLPCLRAWLEMWQADPKDLGQTKVVHALSWQCLPHPVLLLLLHALRQRPPTASAIPGCKRDSGLPNMQWAWMRTNP